MARKKYLLLAVVIAFLHVFLVVGYGMQKEGFHEDEYYTYWSSTNSVPITIKQNYFWNNGAGLLCRFYVRDSERFSISTVVRNQESDVHPPLYYITLNIFMSLFAGRFYKWFGILLNLLYTLITYAGIVSFFYRLDRSKNRKWLSLLTGLCYAVAPSTISSCMLTRMYAMSGMWTIIYANIFLTLIQNYNCSWKKFLKILTAGAVTCYLAFLTHYFTLLVPFVLTLFYCVYVLFKRKGIVCMLVYGFSMLAAIGLAVLTYPASMEHIFHGYRGTGALDGLVNGGFWGMMEYFLPILNQVVFAGWMWQLVALTGICLFGGAILLLIRKIQKKSAPESCFYALAASVSACVFGMWFLCRTALVVGNDASRYFWPVISFLLPVMVYIVGKMAITLLPANSRQGWRIACLIMVTVLAISPLIAGHMQGNILFLYRDEKEKKEFSEKYSQYPAIMIFNADTAYRAWYTEDQLWPFEWVFHVDYEHAMMDFEDQRLFTAEKIVVFMACPPDVLDKLIEANPNLSSYSLVRHDPFFFVYLLE